MNGKKIYVNGGIVIKTPYFKHQNVGCLYENPPENSEYIECIDRIGDQPCLIVKEYLAPSIFNEYYAKTFFSTLYEWAPFFHKNLNDCYSDYQDKIKEFIELRSLPILNKEIEKILLRQVFLGIIAAVDTFICDTILTKISSDKESFWIYFKKFILTKCSEKIKEVKEADLKRMWENNEPGRAEQDVFDKVMKISYCNIETIKDVYKILFNISIYDTQGKMKKHFRTRHLIAHRNGRMKDGKLLDCTKEDIEILINDANVFICQIMKKIN